MKKHKSWRDPSTESKWVGLERLEPRVLLSAAMESLFDEAFYLARYPDIDQAVIDGWFASGFEHYMAHGQAEGRSPSPFYQEDYYLERYPDVAAAVAGGAFESGFEHLANFGQFEGRSGFPFFDEQYYLTMNSDVMAAVPGGLRSGFEHYVNYGWKEARNPSPFFDEQLYRTLYPDVAGAIGSGTFMSGLQHYAGQGAKEGRITTFNEKYYLDYYSDVKVAVDASILQTGRQHYLLYGADESRSFRPLVQENYYLSLYPDAQAAVAGGSVRCALEHLIRYGQFNDYSPTFDEARYLSIYGDVDAAVSGGSLGSGLGHFLKYGKPEGRSASPQFVEKSYLSVNPDAKTAANGKPFNTGLEHYAGFGQYQDLAGRPTSKEFLITGQLNSVDYGQIKVKINEVGTYHTLGGVVVAYQVNLEALAPADIVLAVDVAFEGALYQVAWEPSPPTQILTPDMEYGQNLGDPNIDSHFLLNAGGADWGVVFPPTEDNDFQYGTNGAGDVEGLGTSLSVFAAISAGAWAQDLPFAHIVVPEGSMVYLTGAAGNGSGHVFDFGEGTDGILIP